MPKFQPIQNFDGLSPQTTKGDLIARSTTQAVRVAVGTDGFFLKSDSAQAAGVSWAAVSLAYNYTPQTTTYAAAVSDYAVMSGASFDATLPTAVGNAGKSIILQHAGTAFSQIYSVKTTSSQTVAGLASNVIKINTPGEVWMFTSDGANWLKTFHDARATGTYTPTLSAGWGTVTSSVGNWARDGKWLLLDNYWTNGTIAGTIASATIPTGLTIDATYLTRANTTAASGHKVGEYAGSNGANAGYIVTATGTSSSTLYFTDNFGAAANFLLAALVNDFAANSGLQSFQARIPITEFQP